MTNQNQLDAIKKRLVELKKELARLSAAPTFKGDVARILREIGELSRQDGANG